MANRFAAMSLADSLIHWSTPSADDDPQDEEDASVFMDVLEAGLVDEKGKGKAKESMYVTLCERMVQTVLDHESFLLSDKELEFFTAYRSLSYNARYLLARLLVRKSGKWFRLKDLKYVSELGVEGIEGAIDELSRAQRTANDRTEEADASNLKAKTTSLAIFADDEQKATTAELLECLNVDELKDFARTMKLPITLTTRKAFSAALLATGATQASLKTFVLGKKGKSKVVKDAQPNKFKQTILNFTQLPSSPMKFGAKHGVSPTPTGSTLRNMALTSLKRCIKINDSVAGLFHRLHIIYFRSTEHPTSLLTPALLKWCRKRYYAHYTYVRSSTIFQSREALVAYEAALRMEALMEAILLGEMDEDDACEEISKWAGNPTVTENSEDNVISTVPSSRSGGSGNKENTPCIAQTPVPEDAAKGNGVEVVVATPKKETQAAANARRVLRVFDYVYPRWRMLCQNRGGIQTVDVVRSNGLSRFDEGWILTRIVYKGALAHGCLKNYTREVEILEELLAQRHWRRGKRGLWYDRLALVLMHHLARSPTKALASIVGLPKNDEVDNDGEDENGDEEAKDDQRRVLQRAMDTVHAGLHDGDTHIVQRQSLQQRLVRLEKRLKVPKKDRHECVGKLEKADEILVMGVRVRQHPGWAVVSDKTSVIVNNAQVVHCHVPVSVQIQGKQAVQAHNQEEKKKRLDQAKEQWKGKSIWVGRGREDVTVEILALQYYESLGFKGFHSEGSIVATIFGLLFWDIIFMSVPGAFETPFQSAPLDIVSECFYFARRKHIEKRLQEILDGKGTDILLKADNEHREKATMCVGVRWDLYSKQDLVEIVSSLKPEGTAMICRLFCEDYGGRMSGIPDLIVWRKSDSLCKFVEVKGPGDGLSENQKVWIDVMLRSGIVVELCRVAEKGSDNLLGRKRRIFRKAKPVIKRDLDYRQGDAMPVDDGIEVIVIDSQTDEDEDEVVIAEKPVSTSEAAAVRPRKRHRQSDPGPSGHKSPTSVRGSSPDIPLLLYRDSK